jgi:mono/diheme cytochrome c family protein
MPYRSPLNWIRNIAAGVGSLTVVGGVCAVVWLGFGGFDVSASKPHGSLSYWAIHLVLLRTVNVRAADAPAEPVPTSARVIAGFRQYDAECVRCHGAPGQARDTWADWMNPSPPYLMDVGTRFSDPELFWIVCHGAKMTGMPAWGSHRSDDDIWNLVAFLRALPHIPPAGYGVMRRTFGGPDPAGAGGTPDARCLMQP